jgi:hypothetical protein
VPSCSEVVMETPVTHEATVRLGQGGGRCN